LWAVGYGLTEFMPAHVGAIWMVVIVVGISAGLVTLRGARGGASARRYAGVVATLGGFVIAAAAIMAPTDGRQIAAFISLMVATSYVVAGLWWGSRYIISGITLAALTVGGFFLLRQHFYLWMAVVGGGGLLLAGLWLQRA